MSTKSRQLYGSTMRLASMVAYILLTCLLMIIIEGCDNPNDQTPVPVPPGPAPEISLTGISGGEIVTNSDNEADIIVFRSLNLEGLVLTFTIDIPNGYLRDSFVKGDLDYNSIIVSQDGKSAIASVYVTDVQSGVQMTYSVDDKKGKSRTFTINPLFRIDLSPEDIVSGKWSKTGFNYQDEYDITLLTTTADQSILAVSGKLMRKSSDGGQTWKEVAIPNFNLIIKSIKLHPSGDLYAISNNIIARSSNNGDTWSVLDTNLPSGSIGDIEFSPGGIFILSFNSLNNNNENGIWISDDGILWSQQHAIIDNGELLNSSFYFYDFVVINDSTTLMSVYGIDWGELYLLRSDDYGRTWITVVQIFNYGKTQILLASDGKVYVSSYGVGIKISEDQGMTWKQVQKGIPQEGGKYWINTLFEGADGNIYSAPGNFGVFLLEKNEERWRSVGTDLAAYNVQVFTAIEGKIYAGVQHNGLYMLK